MVLKSYLTVFPTKYVVIYTAASLFPRQMPQRVFSHPSRSVPTLAKHSSLSKEPKANTRIWSLKEGDSSVLHECVFSLSAEIRDHPPPLLAGITALVWAAEISQVSKDLLSLLHLTCCIKAGTNPQPCINIPMA